VTSVGAGRAASITYDISNKGPFAATGVKTTIQLGDSATNLSAQAATGSCNVTSGTITCMEPILQANQSSSIEVSFTYADSGTREIAASIAAEQSDSVPDNNAVSSKIQVLANAPNSPGNSQNGGGGGGGGTSPDLLMLLSLVLYLGRSRMIRRPR
jgi:hypothetical protein